MQILIFCVHNVVLDTIIMAFIFFSPKFFFKNAENPYFFCIGCFVISIVKDSPIQVVFYAL